VSNSIGREQKLDNVIHYKSEAQSAGPNTNSGRVVSKHNVQRQCAECVNESHITFLTENYK